MAAILSRRVGYSRAEYLSDLAVHLVGLLTVAVAVPALIVLASFQETQGSLFGVALYGTSFATVITFSAIYNIFPHPKWEWLLKRLDHSAIYLKIAGVFTALSMVSHSGEALIPAVWAVALLGVALKLVSPDRQRWIALVLYIGLGVVTVLFANRMMTDLPDATFTLLTIGGLTYVVGVVFYLWEQLPFHFTIWHVFVLAGSMLVYSAILVAVV